MALLEPDQLAAVAIETSTIRLSVEEVTGNALRTFPDYLPELTVRLPRQERPRSSGKNLNECSLEMQNLIERHPTRRTRAFVSFQTKEQPMRVLWVVCLPMNLRLTVEIPTFDAKSEAFVKHHKSMAFHL